MIEIENIKANSDDRKLLVQARSEMLAQQLEAIKFDAEDDFKRDELAQKRTLESAKILGDTAIRVDEGNIKREQNEARVSPTAGATEKIAAE